MVIITLKYIKSIELIDTLLSGHRNFLEDCYKRSLFICSGPQNPRIGGVIISKVGSIEEAQQIVKDDPFYNEGAAEYQFIEFNPVKYDERFLCFLSK